jgi:hypothetical protein
MTDRRLKKRSLNVIYDVTYGTPVWYQNLNTVHNKRTIDAAQRGYY